MEISGLAVTGIVLTDRASKTGIAQGTKRKTAKATKSKAKKTRKTVTKPARKTAAKKAKTSVPSAPVMSATSTSPVVSFALAQIGKPYRRNAAGPNTYDCSGLVLAAWRTAGVNLSHSAAGQLRQVSRISRAALIPGDLVFYYSGISHVALYVGSNLIVDAPHSGATVTMRSIDTMPVAAFGRP